MDGKLPSLVAVEDLRFGLDQGPVERADTEITFQSVGDLPTDHESIKPVDDGYKTGWMNPSRSQMYVRSMLQT